MSRPTTRMPASKSRQAKALRNASANGQSDKLEQNLSLELVGAHNSELIHNTVKAILWKVGVIFEHTPTRTKLLRQHGCREADGGYI